MPALQAPKVTKITKVTAFACSLRGHLGFSQVPQ
jgi:hypothetical protein